MDGVPLADDPELIVSEGQLVEVHYRPETRKGDLAALRTVLRGINRILVPCPGSAASEGCGASSPPRPVAA
jgi:hypothetical protein